MKILSKHLPLIITAIFTLLAVELVAYLVLAHKQEQELKEEWVMKRTWSSADYCGNTPEV